MNAAIYTRFSTELQQSTEVQIAKCREYAVKNNMSVFGVYSDEAASGTNVDRGGFERLLYDAQNKRFDTIIIYDITRGSRDVSDWFNFRKLMRNLNINVVSTSEKLGDILNPADFLTELITVGIGQHHVLSTRIKSIDGKTVHARNGEFQGGIAPLGYDIINREYFINEYESKAVKLIFSLYAQGQSYNHIVDELDKLGYRGKRGQKLGKNSLNSILCNDRYIGVYSWNRDIKRQMKIWVGLKDANPNKVEIKDKIPKIIDNETWLKVRLRMKTNKEKGSNTAIEKYALSGKIICDKCGGTFVGHRSTNKKGFVTRYYVCGNKYRNRSCDVRNYNADVVEAEMRLQTIAWLLSENFEEYANAVEAGFLKAINMDKRALYEESKELETKIKRATALILENNNFKSVKDELLKMQTRLDEIGTILAGAATDIIDKNEIIRILTEDVKNIDTLSAETLFSRYIKEIHVLNGEFSVIGGVYSDSPTTFSVLGVNGSSGAKPSTCTLLATFFYEIILLKHKELLKLRRKISL